MFVLLMGAPGAGKGTQAPRLAEVLGIPHISSGDLFRWNIDNLTPVGVEAKKYIDDGNLVPDEITAAMIQERLNQPDAENGAVLDGFPRTVPQIDMLDQMLANAGKRLAGVLLLNVPDEELLRRVGGRWICRNCGASYHVISRPPRVAGKCDRCGRALYQRPDDSLETARQRLDIYYEKTAPIIEFYRNANRLIEVNGFQETERVTEALLDALGISSANGYVAGTVQPVQSDAAKAT